tara:strand:- start:15629 stop:15952 length:324 start_codon:yes stop_codon:yes gene_type:complete
MCNINVQGHHIEVTKSIQTAVNQKFSKLKGISPATSAALNFKQEGKIFEVHLIYHTKQSEIVVKKKNDDLYTAISQAFDVAIRKVKALKPNHRATLCAPEPEQQDAA